MRKRNNIKDYCRYILMGDQPIMLLQVALES